MSDEMKVAYINAQIVCAQIDLAAMQALNAERLANGHTIAYDEAAFLALHDKYCIGHNAVIGYLTGPCHDPHTAPSRRD